MSTHNFPSPKDKSFGTSSVPGVSGSLEEWHGHISVAIAKYSFGPKTGPLRIAGFQADHEHLRALQTELIEEGWSVLIDFEIPGVRILEIYHPHDPACSDFLRK